ncbi:MAG: hypothetical protein U5O16_19885 [Rhodococcus sp. (in: high G+C Gram-positive bacteria)]|uniref:hypothetical protein n=1 Tax=Rhodococcus sp. TaxID=1831 RepID=UPI002AD95158|nr:hypothetical protein [Rhodococcus sp. (in: high G+C Gram-positive bacteria)]
MDGIYAVTPSGVGIAMVNGKEWVVNAQSSQRYDRELAMINAGTFPKLPGFAAGGRLAQDRAKDLGRQMDGVPYVLNGASAAGAGAPALWPCANARPKVKTRRSVVSARPIPCSMVRGRTLSLVPKGPFVVAASMKSTFFFFFFFFLRPPRTERTTSPVTVPEQRKWAAASERST